MPSGQIGSFYLGGDYTNAITIVNPVEITLLPTTSAGVDTSAIGQFPVIRLVAPSNIATGDNPFSFEFSGTPLSGSTPLNVKYKAFNYEPTGRYSGLWEASEFRWWFDYVNSGGPTDYITCATDEIEHLYCGFYGDEYDVRLCVIYRPI